MSACDVFANLYSQWPTHRLSTGKDHDTFLIGNETRRRSVTFFGNNSNNISNKATNQNSAEQSCHFFQERPAFGPVVAAATTTSAATEQQPTTIGHINTIILFADNITYTHILLLDTYIRRVHTFIYYNVTSSLSFYVSSCVAHTRNTGKSTGNTSAILIYNQIYMHVPYIVHIRVTIAWHKL